MALSINSLELYS